MLQKKIVKSHTKTIFMISATFYDQILSLNYALCYINVAKNFSR